MAAPQPILPILERRAEIEAAVESYQVVVICGETGSGKTTQLPQICMAMGLANKGVIGHTQPRRLAARAVAARIAEERGESLGNTVGVQVRFHDQTSSRTRIKVMTDGILLAELSSDHRLSAYSTIIIDEAHERSLNIDFLLGYLKLLLPRRPHLKLIVTSATIDPKRFSDFFGGPAVAPVVEVSGRMFPVEVRYHPTRTPEDEPDRIDFEAVADAVDEVCLRAATGTADDVLVFLPGEREIRLASDAINRRGTDALVLPLYSRLSDQQQDQIFHPARGRRRVILATNVAETSLTVPGIRFVIDTGVARVKRYDAEKKVQRLPVEPISQASANQRSGRCGRVASGVCIRLYGEQNYRARPIFTDPEIRRTSLASVILQLKLMGSAAVEDFPFLDPPDSRAIKDGYETLFELGALTGASPSGILTTTGQRMARMPLDPRIARMLLGAAAESALNEALILAAALSIQDPRERPLACQEQADRAQANFRDETSDFLSLLKLWDQYNHAADTLTSGPLMSWCRDHFLAPNRMREWGELVFQLRDIAKDLGLRPNETPATPDAIHRSLLTGLISNVACREGDGSFDYRGIRSNVVQIHPGSSLFKKGPKWIMAAEVVQTTRLYARTVAKVTTEWIEELAGHMFQHQVTDPHLDTATGESRAWKRVTMSGIVVVPRREIALGTLDPAAARRVFITEGLASARWKTDAPFMQHNLAAIESARTAEAKLRRRDVLVPQDTITAWFDARVPAEVFDPATFDKWQSANNTSLQLTLTDLIRPEAHAALDPALYPDTLTIGQGNEPCPLEYNLSPGKPEDGLTLTIELTNLPNLSPDRAAWLVPGMLPQLTLALLKSLPKPSRATMERTGKLEDIATSCAAVLNFAAAPLTQSLSEALEVLHSIKIDPDDWSIDALPPHLQLRIRVIDHTGKELAVDRDLPSLLKRFEGRITKAQAAKSKTTTDQHNLTSWTFGDLTPDPAQATVPALIDRTTTVSFIHTTNPAEAAAQTPRGLRRLFALACAEEVSYYIDALPTWSDMAKQYAQLGTPEQLRQQITTIIAARAYMENQPPVLTKAAFEQRLIDGATRLPTLTREVGEVIAKTLEPRSLIAHRLSGGTPRIWAESVADIREQAAYLMPAGFLSLVPWDRLRHYPRYVTAMRERLLTMREDGLKSNLDLLRQLAPHWKRLTSWVSTAMAIERDRADAEPDTTPTTKPTSDKSKSKAPLPQAKRAAPRINLDAGEWLIQPGNTPQSLDAYRWALEEFRLSLFAPKLILGKPTTPADLDHLWAQVPVMRRT